MELVPAKTLENPFLGLKALPSKAQAFQDALDCYLVDTGEALSFGQLGFQLKAWDNCTTLSNAPKLAPPFPVQSLATIRFQLFRERSSSPDLPIKEYYCMAHIQLQNLHPAAGKTHYLRRLEFHPRVYDKIRSNRLLYRTLLPNESNLLSAKSESHNRQEAPMKQLRLKPVLSAIFECRFEFPFLLPEVDPAAGIEVPRPRRARKDGTTSFNHQVNRDLLTDLKTNSNTADDSFLMKTLHCEFHYY